MTLADLDGYNHPLGIRFKKFGEWKGSSFIPETILTFAAGRHTGKEEPDTFQIDWDTDEGLSEACKILKDSCSESQRQAIVHLIKLIRRYDLEHKQKDRKKKAEKKKYCYPLSKSNHWGRPLLFLAEAFEVKLNKLGV